MKTSFNLGVALLMTMLFFACGNKGGGGETPKSAEEYKQEILTLDKGLEGKMAQLEQRRISIEIQGRALTDDEIKWLDQYGALQLALGEWRTAWEKGGTSSSNTAELQEYLGNIKGLDKNADDLAK